MVTPDGYVGGEGAWVYSARRSGPEHPQGKISIHLSSEKAPGFLGHHPLNDSQDTGQRHLGVIPFASEFVLLQTKNVVSFEKAGSGNGVSHCRLNLTCCQPFCGAFHDCPCQGKLPEPAVHRPLDELASLIALLFPEVTEDLVVDRQMAAFQMLGHVTTSQGCFGQPFDDRPVALALYQRRLHLEPVLAGAHPALRYSGEAVQSLADPVRGQ